MDIVSQICIITTGILLVFILWSCVEAFFDGFSLADAKISFILLPEILAIGAVTGTGTVMIISGALTRNLSSSTKLWLNGLFVLAATMILGRLFGFYDGIVGAVGIFLSVLFVFAFTYFINFFSSIRNARIINQQLSSRFGSAPDDTEAAEVKTEKQDADAQPMK